MAEVTKTYLSKSNTIFENEPLVNTGLNPVIELNYGKLLSRALIYFDHSKIKKMVEDKVYPDVSKLRHVLKMVNAADVNKQLIENCTLHTYAGEKQRATSFDIILFLVPKMWDNGRGFDFVNDLYVKQQKAYSCEGSSWVNATSAYKWKEEGIYSYETLEKELKRYATKGESNSDIIIGHQHFDFGNESLEIDITDTVNKFIDGSLTNYGMCLAFAPYYEMEQRKDIQYVAFFSDKTNTFYEPYVETTYDDTIQDDRVDFCLGRVNKLYFYASVGGSNVNLDKLPTCTIESSEIAVKQATKGVYYVEVDGDDYEEEVMYYDEWSDIVYKGKTLKNVEMSFVPKAQEEFFTMGLPKNEEKVNLIPNLYGINYDERILREDTRKVNVELNIPYTTNQTRIVDNVEYRLYVKEDDKERDVIPFTKVEHAYNEMFFLIKTQELIPARYFIDIKVTQDLDVIHHDELLRFDIVGSKTDIYS